MRCTILTNAEIILGSTSNGRAQKSLVAQRATSSCLGTQRNQWFTLVRARGHQTVPFQAATGSRPVKLKGRPIEGVAQALGVLIRAEPATPRRLRPAQERELRRAKRSIQRLAGRTRR